MLHGQTESLGNPAKALSKLLVFSLGVAVLVLVGMLGKKFVHTPNHAMPDKRIGGSKVMGMLYNITLGSFRTLLGLALIGSVIWQVTDRIANNLFRPFEYFAYFSIDTAILAGLVLVITGLGLLLQQEDSKWIEIIRLSLTVALIVVGVVYHLLLANADPDPRDIGYNWPVLPNQIIHTYAPILIVIDYLLSQKAFRVRLRAALWSAVFPLTWLVFSVVRGSLDGWWPYWFIDPNGEGGLTGMLTYVGAITGFFLVLGFIVLGIKKLLSRILKIQ